MISEQDKQAILNGAYGIDRKGRKVKYIGQSSNEKYPHFVVTLNEYDEIKFWRCLSGNFDDVPYKEGEFDVVGLWQDKPEPFDLERALAGEPVMLRDGSKACILSKLPKRVDFNYFPSLPLIGLEEGSLKFLYWAENGRASMINDETSIDIVSMWKDPEPESNTVTLTLPCPLKEPKEGMWFINSIGEAYESNYKGEAGFYDDDSFNAGFYFATKEDAQAWLNAMKNNRR